MLGTPKLPKEQITILFTNVYVQHVKDGSEQPQSVPLDQGNPLPSRK